MTNWSDRDDYPKQTVWNGGDESPLSSPIGPIKSLSGDYLPPSEVDKSYDTVVDGRTVTVDDLVHERVIKRRHVPFRYTVLGRLNEHIREFIPLIVSVTGLIVAIQALIGTVSALFHP